MKATFLLLTYKEHIQKEEYKGWFPEHTGWDVGDIAIAHETGDEKVPYLHSHVVVHLKRSRTISKKRTSFGFDFNGIHPHVRFLKGRKAYNDALKYISKEDNDIGVSTEMGMNDWIELCQSSTIDVALSECKNLREVVPVLQMHGALNQGEVETDEWVQDWADNMELNSYQQLWLDMLLRQDNRKILWICDYIGDLGKTTLETYLVVKHGAEILPMKSADAGMMWNGSGIVSFDIVREHEGYVSYRTIEEIKNGRQLTGKYRGRRRICKPPKVIVFSNFYPDKSKLSADRWNILVYGSGPTNIKENVGLNACGACGCSNGCGESSF